MEEDEDADSQNLKRKGENGGAEVLGGVLGARLSHTSLFRALEGLRAFRSPQTGDGGIGTPRSLERFLCAWFSSLPRLRPL